MDGMKYIMVETGICRTPFIFPLFVDHSDMWRAIHNKWPGYTLLSAGFVEIDNGKAYAFGNSTSLKIGAEPEDSAIISRMLVD